MDATPEGAGPLPVRHVLIHANGEEASSLATALRVARQAAHELDPGTRFHIVVQGALVRRLTVGSEFASDLDTTVSDTVRVAACRNSMIGRESARRTCCRGWARCRRPAPISPRGSGRGGPTSGTDRSAVTGDRRQEETRPGVGR